MSNSHPSVLKYPITTQLGTDHDQPPPPCNPRANAFLIPARPYLERVAAFPRDGREAQLAGVREMVNEIKKIDGDAWAAAGEGCGRIMVSAHDTGTFAASEADPSRSTEGGFHHRQRGHHHGRPTTGSGGEFSFISVHMAIR